MIPPEATGTASPKKPFFRKPLLVLLSLSAAIPGFYAFENWRGNRAWEEHCRLLREQGHPIQFVSIARTPGQPRQVKPKLEQDFEAADRLFSKTEQLLRRSNPPGSSHPTEDLSAWAQALRWVVSGQKEDGFRLNISETNTVARTRAAEAILEDFSVYDEVLRELRSACRRPELAYPFGYEEGPFRSKKVFPAIDLCRRLRLKTSAQFALGRTSDAIRELDLMLTLGDSLRSGPGLYTTIGSLSCRRMALEPFRDALSGHLFAESELRQLESMFRSENLVEDVPQLFRWERDSMLSFYESGGVTVEHISGCKCPIHRCYYVAFRLMPSGWDQWGKLVYSAAIEQIITSGYIEAEKRILPAGFERAESALRVPTGWRTLMPHSFLLASFLPRMSAFALNSTATRVTTDHMRIGCGIELHCLKNGDDPKDLEQLVPEFISSMPLDPITGKPYHYQPALGGGYKLWSVGADEVDGGGVSGGATFDGTPGDWVTVVGPWMRTAAAPQVTPMD